MKECGCGLRSVDHYSRPPAPGRPNPAETTGLLGDRYPAETTGLLGPHRVVRRRRDIRTQAPTMTRQALYGSGAAVTPAFS